MEAVLGNVTLIKGSEKLELSAISGEGKIVGEWKIYYIYTVTYHNI